MSNNKIDPVQEKIAKRQTRLNLRLTDEECQLVRSRADGFGLSLAKFVRVFLLDLPKPAKRLHDLPSVDPKLLRQIVSIGNNVNQLTRYAHTVSNDPKQTLDILTLAFNLEEIANELRQLREHYSLSNVDSDNASVIDSPVTEDQIASPVTSNVAKKN